MKKIGKAVFLITVTSLLLTYFIFIRFGKQTNYLLASPQYEVIDDIGSADDGLPVIGNYNINSRIDVLNYEVIDDIVSNLHSKNNTNYKIIAKINTSNVNFRKDANASSDIYYKLELNTAVEVINSDTFSSWYEVKHVTDFCSSTIGFVSKKYLTF